jgi:glycosyltransferase involved in cell wall biosynthesis
MIIAYMSALYARASDSFIRGEVRQLRARGHTVYTFSARRGSLSELVSDDIRREYENTEYLVDGGISRLFLSGLKAFFRSPAKMFAAAKLAIRTSPPGLKAHLWQFAYLLEAALLAEHMRKKGVQHLHNHIAEGSATISMLASLLTDIPYSLTVHGPGEFDRAVFLALDEKIKRCRFVAAISEFARSQLYRWCDYQCWPKIHVVHCGVSEEFLSQQPRPVTAGGRLVCVGRLSIEKGHLLLVEAVGRLVTEGLHFEVVVIGDGPMKDDIKSLVEERGLKDHVRLVGWMSSEAVREEILRSHVLVMPSFAEGLPVAIMEALALERPVICTHIAGIPELVQPGICGWLVPPGSVEALTNAMREALQMPLDQLQKLGHSGRMRVAERHNQSTEVGKLEALISQSLNTR